MRRFLKTILLACLITSLFASPIYAEFTTDSGSSSGGGGGGGSEGGSDNSGGGGSGTGEETGNEDGDHTDYTAESNGDSDADGEGAEVDQGGGIANLSGGGDGDGHASGYVGPYKLEYDFFFDFDMYFNQLLYTPKVTALHSLNALCAQSGDPVYFMPKLEEFPTDLTETCADTQTADGKKHKFAIVYGGYFDNEVVYSRATPNSDDEKAVARLQTSKKIYSMTDNSRCLNLLGYDLLLKEDDCEIENKDDKITAAAKPVLVGNNPLETRTCVMDLYKAMGVYDWDIKITHGKDINKLSIDTSPIMQKLAVLTSNNYKEKGIDTSEGATYVWATRTNPMLYWERCDRDAIFDGGAHLYTKKYYRGNDVSVTFAKSQTDYMTMAEFCSLARAIMSLYGEPIVTDRELELAKQNYTFKLPTGSWSQEMTDSIMYLAAKGILEPDKVTLNKNVTFQDIEPILLRIADKGSRITLMSTASALNGMVQQGYVEGNIREPMEGISFEKFVNPFEVEYYDYLIEACDETNFYARKLGTKDYSSLYLDPDLIDEEDPNVSTVSVPDVTWEFDEEDTTNLVLVADRLTIGAGSTDNHDFENLGIEYYSNTPYYHFRVKKELALSGTTVRYDPEHSARADVGDIEAESELKNPKRAYLVGELADTGYELGCDGGGIVHHHMPGMENETPVPDNANQKHGKKNNIKFKTNVETNCFVTSHFSYEFVDKPYEDNDWLRLSEISNNENLPRENNEHYNWYRYLIPKSAKLSQIYLKHEGNTADTYEWNMKEAVRDYKHDDVEDPEPAPYAERELFEGELKQIVQTGYLTYHGETTAYLIALREAEEDSKHWEVMISTELTENAICDLFNVSDKSAVSKCYYNMDDGQVLLNPKMISNVRDVTRLSNDVLSLLIGNDGLYATLNNSNNTVLIGNTLIKLPDNEVIWRQIDGISYINYKVILGWAENYIVVTTNNHDILPFASSKQSFGEQTTSVVPILNLEPFSSINVAYMSVKFKEKQPDNSIIDDVHKGINMTGSNTLGGYLVVMDYANEHDYLFVYHHMNTIGTDGSEYEFDLEESNDNVKLLNRITGLKFPNDENYALVCYDLYQDENADDGETNPPGMEFIHYDYSNTDGTRRYSYGYAYNPDKAQHYDTVEAAMNNFINPDAVDTTCVLPITHIDGTYYNLQLNLFKDYDGIYPYGMSPVIMFDENMYPTSDQMQDMPMVKLSGNTVVYPENYTDDFVYDQDIDLYEDKSREVIDAYIKNSEPILVASAGKINLSAHRAGLMAVNDEPPPSDGTEFNHTALPDPEPTVGEYDTINLQQTSCMPAPVANFAALNSNDPVDPEHADGTTYYGTSIVTDVSQNHLMVNSLNLNIGSNPVVPVYRAGAASINSVQPSNFASVNRRIQPAQTTYSLTSRATEGLVDWDQYSFSRLVDNLDSWSSIILLFALGVLPRVAMLLFFILILLSLIKDVRPWQLFCENVFDVYSFLTMGRQTVQTIDMKRTVWFSLISLTLFMLIMDGNLINFIIWVCRWVIALYQR